MSSSWLHSLKGWGLRETRGGSIGCTPQTLSHWIRKAKDKSSPEATTGETRVKELEREVLELRRANEILKLASAFFAQAELDRRLK